MSDNPLLNWQVDPQAIDYIGEDLQRPECILAQPNGTIYSADARGGVMEIHTDGSQRFIGQKADPRMGSGDFADRYVNTQGTLTNGLAFDNDGNFLIANFGTDCLEIMDWQGNTKTLIHEIDGRPVGKANFVTRDSKNRLWLTVTTRTNPWTKSVTNRTHDGYIALMDEQGIRIVADGLCGTNELRFDDNEEWLYVAETTERHITRFRIQDDGRLTHREIFGPRVLDGFCDGIAFDSYGNLWSTLIMAEKLIAITPQGDVLTLLDDEPEHWKNLDAAWHDYRATPELMAASVGAIAPWMASITFGGPDLKTVYLGSLQGTKIPYFSSPVPGQPLIYWPK